MATTNLKKDGELIVIPATAFEAFKAGDTFKGKAINYTGFRDGMVFLNVKIGDNGVVRTLASREDVRDLTPNEDVTLEFREIREYASGSYPILGLMLNLKGKAS